MSLYFITNPGWRLGLVAFWTSLFSLAVSVLSTARRAEIFGAGAAYAAVSPVPLPNNSIITHTINIGTRCLHIWKSCNSEFSGGGPVRFNNCSPEKEPDTLGLCQLDLEGCHNPKVPSLPRGDPIRAMAEFI